MKTPAPPGLRHAPREVFELILDYAVIPTFDLIVRLPDRRVVLVRRKIAPYGNTWALPGLRMMKPEGIDDTLARIAQSELGISIQTEGRRFIGQYVGRFKTEHRRQDLSTCYTVATDATRIAINQDHFHGLRLIGQASEIPRRTGAMYRFFLQRYFDSGSNHTLD
ncbi:MAG: NUDIX domain-containing protein [Candidatus Contendobacter sp.]|nr:NUDIX domain-containing protein [Candidatus Contendobacter sp.]